MQCHCSPLEIIYLVFKCQNGFCSGIIFTVYLLIGFNAAVGTLELEKDGTLKCQARGLLIVCIIVAISSQKCSNIKPGSLQTQCRELLSVHQHTGAHSMKRICSWNVKVKLWSASKISKKKWHL